VAPFLEGLEQPDGLAVGRAVEPRIPIVEDGAETVAKGLELRDSAVQLFEL
jgi:hypothetical protein